MNAHADKSQENKNQPLSSGHSQKQSSGKSTFQFVDNRSEAVAQQKLQEMANNSPQVSQLKSFQEIINSTGMNHSSELDNGVVQGKFVGPLSGILKLLSPTALSRGGIPSDIYEKLWNDLMDDGTEINVGDGAPTYSQSTTTINLRGMQIMALLNHCNRGDDASKILPSDEIASFMGMITHELSHAHDHVILGKVLAVGGLARVKSVLDTELLAWRREAIVAKNSANGGENDTAKEALLNGWRNLKIPSALVFLRNCKKADESGNPLLDRLRDYLFRELLASDGDYGRRTAWMNEHEEWLVGVLTDLQAPLLPDQLGVD